MCQEKKGKEKESHVSLRFYFYSGKALIKYENVLHKLKMCVALAKHTSLQATLVYHKGKYYQAKTTE